MLYRVVDESGFKKIIGGSTLEEAWGTSQNMYKGFDQVKQAHLQTQQGELDAMKMKESEDYLATLLMCKR